MDLETIRENTEATKKLTRAYNLLSKAITLLSLVSFALALLLLWSVTNRGMAFSDGFEHRRPAKCQTTRVSPDGLHLFVKYDDDIQEASKRWLPLWDWRLLKAQLYQESLLDPSVCSRVGACGIAQFMPGTWKEVQADLNAPPDLAARFIPGYAIPAAAYYDFKLRRQWTADRSETERQKLVLASYNAGAGNIMRAQRVCKRIQSNCNSWAEISVHLSSVTGHHSRETITYVQRIGRWLGILQEKQP